jgi:hypothetical protein
MSQPDLTHETLPTPEQEAAARYKFLLLYAEPFRILEECGDGQGAFAALSLGLFLCDRYFRHKSDSMDAWREEKFLAEAATHYGMEYELFREFWSIYRHGMLYQGAPKATEAYGWALSEDYSSVPTKVSLKGKAVIGLNPWGFAAEMIVLCWNDPAALARICDVSLDGALTVAPGWKFAARG